MGLILGPLMLAWAAAALFSLRMGYVLFADGKIAIPQLLTAAAVALVLTVAYVLIGLTGFKQQASLWAFEIPIFFTTNKFGLAAYAAALLLYLFGDKYISHALLLPLSFVIAFSSAFGALIGTVSSNTFMEKYNITITY